MSFLDRIGLEHPVVQAGMGGGLATAALAGEVSAAGGLGTVGILPAPDFERELRLARERAGERPVAANLLVPFARRGHVEACARAGVRVVVLHAGFNRSLAEQLNGHGILVLQTVGTVPEAKRALAEGAGGLVVQGVEAGGHLVGVRPALEALAAVQGVTRNHPVLVAGGIAEHEDVRRALDAGADAVVAGTRFLLTDECPAHPAYKRRVLTAKRTIETQLFGFGWPMRHRVVPNAATERWCREDGRARAMVLAVERFSGGLARLPMTMAARTLALQRLSAPIFGPSALLEGMPERLVDVSALYSGETALRIESLLPAGEAVRRLAGVAPASPTIQP